MSSLNQGLDTNLQTLSDDTFAQLMGEVPDSTVNTDSLVSGVKQEEKSEEKKDDKSSEEKKSLVPQKSQEEVSKDMDSLFDDEDEDDDKTEEKKNQSVKQKSESKSKAPQDDEIVHSLKTQYEYLVEKGVWDELEDIDNFEFSTDNFAELTEQQAKWKAQSAFENLVDSTGDYGKAILDFVKNGGNPDEIIDLFKEAQNFKNLNIETEQGQTTLVTKYYKDLGWSDAKIDRYIKSAIDNNTLVEEAEEVKSLIEKDIQEEIKSTQKQQEEYSKAQEEAQKKFSENITKAVSEIEELNDKEKREILADLLVYDKKLPNGKIVNQFALDFSKLQTDPKKYIQLVRFVKDPENFTKKIAKQEEKKAVKKTWNFVKGNGALQRGTGTAHNKITSGKDSDLTIDYKSFL